MFEFKLKNVMSPGYKPPATWEEFKALERPARILAARYFIRQAAIRLQAFGLRPDDIVGVFDAVPEWISHQLHEYKREQAELRKTWLCNKCGYKAPKSEFFKDHDQLTFLIEDRMAICPECGRTDAEHVAYAELREDQGPPQRQASPSQVIQVSKEQALDLVQRAAAAQLPDLCTAGPVEPGDGKASSCDCEGQPCPVCQGILKEQNPPLIKDHHCSRCQTYFCTECHGVSSAQLVRAYGEVGRCKCGGSE
jgi:hypothetical protein